MINLDHFKYFVDAARAGSLSEAARLNRVSQSAVSQAIRGLERSIGHPLTRHRRNRFELTDEGKAVLLHSDEVFRSVRTMTDSLEAIGKGYSGIVTVGCTFTLATDLLPAALIELARKYPALHPVVRVGNSELIRDWLLRGEVDLGLMVDDGARASELRRERIRVGEYLLFRATGRRAGGGGLVVTRRERPEVRHYTDRLAQRKKAREVRCEITSWGAVLALVARSGYWGICPDYVVREGIARRKLVEVDANFSRPRYELIALYPERRPPGRNGRLLIEALAARAP